MTDSNNVWVVFNDLQNTLLHFRTVLRRLPGNAAQEVAAVALRRPLQVIEDQLAEIKAWLESKGKFNHHTSYIIHPNGRRDDLD